MAAMMMGIEIGQRVSYKRRGTIRHGTVVAFRMAGFTGLSYVVRDDASGIEHAVLPQHIIR